MIQLACEAPKVWMEEVGKYTDFEYALAHLILKDKDYLDYFKRALLNGKSVILDNSAFELLHPLPQEDVLEARRLLYEDDFTFRERIKVIAPDILACRELTVLKATQFRAAGDLKSHEVMVTIQGANVDDRFQCYKDYRWNRFTDLAIPAGWTLKEGQPVSVVGESERLELIRRIGEAEKGFIRIHLLGCTHFDETLKEYQKLRYVRSMDTSYPVLAAWEGRDLKTSPEKSKVKMNDIYLNEDSGSRELIYKNISAFKEMINE